jgi:hypothetical protein
MTISIREGLTGKCTELDCSLPANPAGASAGRGDRATIVIEGAVSVCMPGSALLNPSPLGRQESADEQPLWPGAHPLSSSAR